MKKLFAFITTGSIYIAASMTAFAQNTGLQPGPISPCSNGTLNGFNPICSVTSNPGRLIGFVIDLLLIAAVVISLIFLIIGGIRWITSGGDKSKLESARGTVVAAIVGLIIALAAFFIINLVLSLFHIGGINAIQFPGIPQG